MSGSVAVPVEPTPKMLAATWDHEIDKSGGIESQNTRNARIWTAMLAAAPAPSSLAGGEVNDEWAERFCEAVNWSPEGQECKTVEGELRCTTFRQIAKGHILAAIATNPYPDNAALSPEAPAREGVEPWKEGREEGRLAARPWRKGDPVPAVGTMVLVSGAHGDIESDQHRAFQWRRVIGYGVDGADFICLQNKGCWPTVERMENCWFAALTPRHEAPAETLGYLFEDDDGTEWSEADPRVSGENEYATNVRPVTLAMAVAEMRSAWELLSEQREALIQADLKIRSLPGTDQSDVEGLRAVIDAKHEAPAEGAGDDVAKLIYEAMKWAAEHAGNDNIPAWVEGGNSFAQDQARSFIPPIVAAFRARSSAPEAREEALGNLLAVIHGDGGHRALEVGTKQAALEAEKIVAGLFAAPSADKLREFGKHTNLELSYGHGDEAEDGAWQVHSVNGGVNDREWDLIGSGATPADAIDQALDALKAEGV